MNSNDKLCLYIWAILCPPVAVALIRGCGADFSINIFLLIICFGIVAVIHAFFLISQEEERRARCVVAVQPVVMQQQPVMIQQQPQVVHVAGPPMAHVGTPIGTPPPPYQM